jgi:Lon protease-like protein
MYRLPIFPLPLVLFPGQELPLHIFEPRYRRMVERCVEGDRRFGVVYHDPDLHGPWLNAEGAVGCVAEIQERQLFPDGRSLLITEGRERFSVQDGVEGGEPFHEAVVLPLEDRPEHPIELSMERTRLIGLFRALIDALPEPPASLPPLSVDEEVSFRLARVIRIEPGWQQELLQADSELDRLERLGRLFSALLKADDPFG